MAHVEDGAMPPGVGRGGRWLTLLTGTALLAAAGLGLVIAGPGRVFDTADFPARWQCGTWDEALGWLHIVSNAAIFAAYLAIPLVIVVFVRRRQDLPFTGLFVLFSVFILSCGVVHLIESVIFWQPLYRLSGVLLVVTAVASWATVFALGRSMPQILALPSLAREVATRRQTEQELARTNADLIASRASAERYLRESRSAEAMARLVVESAPNAQVMVDADGRIVLFNSMAERIFGYARDDVLGESIERLVPILLRTGHEGQRREYQRSPSAREMGSGRELFGLHKDGTEVPVEIGLTPLTTAEGDFVLAAIIDITNRKRTERELLAYAEALAASNQELEQFAQFASHDLQEPLRKLISFAALLEEDLPGELPEAARADLGYITYAAQRMRALVRGLLDLSHSSRRELRPEQFGLADCVTDALEAISELVRETEATIEVGDLPSILGDRLLVTQLFQNLIANALKFRSPEVRPAVRISALPAESGAEIVVADNGIGIQPEFAEEIFKPFRRLHSRDRFPGTGIGLALCKKAVVRHGGRIWVVSELGKGAAFHFTLRSRPNPGDP